MHIGNCITGNMVFVPKMRHTGLKNPRHSNRLTCRQKRTKWSNLAVITWDSLTCVNYLLNIVFFEDGKCKADIKRKLIKLYSIPKTLLRKSEIVFGTYCKTYIVLFSIVPLRNVYVNSVSRIIKNLKRKVNVSFRKSFHCLVTLELAPYLYYVALSP